MKVKQTSIRCLLGILAILVLGLGRADGQEKKAARPLSEAEIKTILLKATAICRTTDLPYDMDRKAKQENGDYLKTIQPILDQGKGALPLLRKLAAAADLPLLERRLTRIIAARIEHPEQFAAVVPYYAPAELGPFSGGGRQLSPPWCFRDTGPEVVHPDVRKEYGRLMGELGAIQKRFLERFKRIEARVAKDDPKACEELAEMMEKKAEEAGKLYDQMTKKCYDQNLRLRMDPVYLLAWEEALLRPVYRTMKNHFAIFVIQIGDPASAPVLAEFLRRAEAVDRPIPYSTFGLNPFKVRDALQALPAKPALLALADVLRNAKGAEERNKLRDMFGRIGFNREKELAKLETDPQFKKELSPLREVTNWYEKTYGERIRKNREREKTSEK